jgi:hypothetical protein
MNSRYFNLSAVKGLNKIGDILIPGNETYPSFSSYMCIDHIDDLMAYAPADDVGDLKMVLGIFSLLPKGILTWIVKKMASAPKSDGPLSGLFRQLNMGIRGVVFSLYYSEKPGHKYSGKNPTELIGFTLNKVND